MKKTYNKLVRDRIIEIITKDGETPSYKILNDEEYFRSLSKKLVEEADEYKKSGKIEELADVAEVIEAILKAKSVSSSEFNEIKINKAKERGGFEDKIFLISVSD